MDDQAGQEEAHEERRFQIHAALVGSRRADEPEEEQEPAEKERRVMSVHHRPGHEREVHRGDPRRNRQRDRIASRSFILGLVDIGHRRTMGERPKLPLVEEEVRRRGRGDGECRPPSEVPEHERRVPAPRTRHHQHRRRGEMRQRAADRDVHEKQSERRVLERGARLQIVELARQQQRADRHRRRLGDERAEQRPDRQDRDPPGGGVPPPSAATRLNAPSEKLTIGRVEASAMMTTTKSGSV